MTKTVVSDIQIPANWDQYIAYNSTVLTPFWTSGVVQNVPSVQISNGGVSVNMPFFNDIDDAVQVLSDSSPLTVNKVTTGSHVAVVNSRGGAWSVNDLTRGYSGADPLAHIQSRVTAWWTRRLQDQLIKIASGIFGVAGMAANKLDISVSGGQGASPTQFNALDFIDADHKLGDHRGQLGAIAAHSDLIGLMEKQNLIDFLPDSEGRPVRSYRDKVIIEVDSLAPSSSVYTMYLFGPGAFGFAEGIQLASTEFFRDILAGDTQMTTRRSYVLHPMGLSYTGTPPSGSGSPDDTAMGTSGNYTLDVDHKLVPIVQMKCKLS